jgi:hypothetical protein
MTDEELVKRLREPDEMTCADGMKAADRIEQLINLNEALVELLDTARADAKEAEAYAEELEKEIELNEQEACMVEDDLIKADKEIDDLKAKLAKAVDALRQIAEQTKGVTPEPDNLQIAIGSIHSYARALLAEIEGEKG